VAEQHGREDAAPASGKEMEFPQWRMSARLMIQDMGGLHEDEAPARRKNSAVRVYGFPRP
jgi:hypothetical protein